MAIILLYVIYIKLRNLYITDTDKYTGSMYGLSYDITVYRFGRLCSIKIYVNGTIDGASNPVLLTLPQKYRPMLQHRLKGYGTESDWIVRTNGAILTSGNTGTSKSNNDIGFTYITID